MKASSSNGFPLRSCFGGVFLKGLELDSQRPEAMDEAEEEEEEEEEEEDKLSYNIL